MRRLIVDVGDRVVVAGNLVRDRSDASPFRSSGLPQLRLEGRLWQRLVVSLLRLPP